MDASAKTCMKCGNPVGQAAQFCDKCGTRFSTQELPTPESLGTQAASSSTGLTWGSALRLMAPSLIIGALIIAGISLLVLVGGRGDARSLNNEMLNAAIDGDLPRVERLLKEGADIRAQSPANSYDTALHIAVQLARPDMVDVLLKKGADINARNDLGYTPLLLGATYGSMPDGKDAPRALCAAELLRSKPDLDAKSKKGESALMVAIDNRDEALVYALVTAGADVNTRNPNGKSILQLAKAESGLDRSVKILEKAGAKP